MSIKHKKTVFAEDGTDPNTRAFSHRSPSAPRDHTVD